MSRRIVWNLVATMILAYGLLAPANAAAQGTQPPPSVQPPAEQPRIRVKLLVEKMDGTKVAGSLPLELLVKQGSQATLNHGKDVPVQQMSISNNLQSNISYTYRSVGYNVAISSATATDKIVSFQLMVDISALDTAGTNLTPLFKKYSMQTNVVVRPGEATIVAVSTDPLSNETARLTVTAEIVK